MSKSSRTTAPAGSARPVWRGAELTLSSTSSRADSDELFVVAELGFEHNEDTEPSEFALTLRCKVNERQTTHTFSATLLDDMIDALVDIRSRRDSARNAASLAVA